MLIQKNVQFNYFKSDSTNQSRNYYNNKIQDPAKGYAPTFRGWRELLDSVIGLFKSIPSPKLIETPIECYALEHYAKKLFAYNKGNDLTSKTKRIQTELIARIVTTENPDAAVWLLKPTSSPFYKKYECIPGIFIEPMLHSFEPIKEDITVNAAVNIYRKQKDPSKAQKIVQGWLNLLKNKGINHSHSKAILALGKIVIENSEKIDSDIILEALKNILVTSKCSTPEVITSSKILVEIWEEAEKRRKDTIENRVFEKLNEFVSNYSHENCNILRTVVAHLDKSAIKNQRKKDLFIQIKIFAQKILNESDDINFNCESLLEETKNALKNYKKRSQSSY